MPTFRIPTLFNSRRSFHRLRSFHLSPAEAAAIQQPASPKIEPISPPPTEILPRNVAIPMRGSIIAKISLIVSLVFISTISLAFIGGDIVDPYFELELNKLADTSPGIILIGESVDVDVDEPSVTVRWSILACGEQFVLPGSIGVHGSPLCGLPSQPLYFFVDNDQMPTATYDPSQIPYNKDTGSRRSIQNLVQFDSDHVLDVHQARLYPFDNYLLTSTIRAVSHSNETLPIRKLAAIDVTSSFNIFVTDTESYSTSTNGTEIPSRDMDMRVTRPASARAFALLLFGISWILTHVTVGLVLVSRRFTEARSKLKTFALSAVILVAIPQLRNSMPDAPGLDGVLIDSIGFFPQMIITAISVITLLLSLIGREIDVIRASPLPRAHPTLPSMSPIPSPPRHRLRPPPSPTAKSSSMEIAHYEMHRLMKHLQGQYVFPPVKYSHSMNKSSLDITSHRKTRTMTRIMESGDVSRWSMSSWAE
ncbi:hypothetical protein BDZ94DRAFT_1259943 [Collybia nuda]|uniref:Transmembrane protein n=1 Tax=Collybia nuda TaxID=64659 RepID=A0A9P6CEN0_9AGAR|nr:hypothetical protein BDZ94DRAFT_1259943 [Collybia nuda]